MMGESAPAPRRAEVVTAGEAMLLLLAEPPQPLRSATRFHRSVAGAEFNVAVGLARLGHRVQWFGALGTDTAGDVIMERLRGEGVEAAGVQRRPDRRTGLLLRDAPRGRPIAVEYHRQDSAGAALAPNMMPRRAVAGAQLVHLTGITPALSPQARDATMHLAELARAGNVPVALDPNFRRMLWEPVDARPVIAELAGYASTVLVGDEEGDILSGSKAPAAIADWFLERGAELVVVKRGALGAWATDGDAEWSSPALQADVLDPVGAGDAFAAAFLSRQLSGSPVESRLLAGNAAGALVVQTYGDLEGLPTATELAAVIGDAPDVSR